MGPDPNRGTLLLTRSDITGLLDLRDCIAAVEDAFRQHATGKAGEPGVLGIHVEEGSFHVKAAALTLERPYFAAKLNANFPHNGPRLGLPTIRGVLALCDASNGAPLAVMDSMSITALRTAAASALAAKYLARERCDTALICGCGGGAPAQMRALCLVRRPRRVLAYDQDAGKQEIDPQLLAHCTLVVDLLEQCCAIGDLHHAIDAGLMARGDVHAQLGEIVAGAKRGRARDDEVIVFDSSGTALQDVAAAAAVYRRALAQQQGNRFSFDA